MILFEIWYYLYYFENLGFKFVSILLVNILLLVKVCLKRKFYMGFINICSV